MPKIKLDAIDRRILFALQKNARIANVNLAEEVGLSASPCLRRVGLLEREGIIRGYHASLDRSALGFGLTVFVNVKVERHDDEAAEAFRAAIRVLPEVVTCHLVSGDADFLLQVVVPDLHAYERLLLGALLKAPGVRDIRSNIAIQTVKDQPYLPLDRLTS
ncbi:Lrp/AsnC family transcriptional regulator [Fulvimarina sp. 2208YS6-2-32]|uniref:Lrp/AsnC family transcriptional regulator n=1 Tax=Fulvimarina uroteuthidis TaxID=3098149 RepID=A0ABU5I5D2_9HYPH|nr:Lrp/AsnC family transcriptional regulator [Fulvimarina sp. 2208YS6-2-32]MDY8110320.1 Lrp/AsnC family transcriptional regulator [Fulvimarina sp. 2208YS6-2-32]